MSEFRFYNHVPKRIDYLEKELSIKLLKAIIVTKDSCSIANITVQEPKLEVTVYCKFNPPYKRVFNLYGTFDDKTLNPIINFNKNEHLGYEHRKDLLDKTSNDDYITHIIVEFKMENEGKEDYIHLVTDELAKIDFKDV